MTVEQGILHQQHALETIQPGKIILIPLAD
jgi:hypothetical protein